MWLLTPAFKISKYVHVASVHEGMKPFRCDICDFSSSHFSSMNRNVESVHEGKKPLKCNICDYSCCQKREINIFVASVHEGKKPLISYHFIYNPRYILHAFLKDDFFWRYIHLHKYKDTWSCFWLCFLWHIFFPYKSYEALAA